MVSLGQHAVLDGRYELLRRIGQGAAGSVWIAYDRELEITVAVKILRPQCPERSEKVLAQFRREAELSERMLSPNVVRILGRRVRADGPCYIAYELLDGEDLGTKLHRDGTLTVQETELVLLHVSRALTRVHAMGIVHRDIKPENIFLTMDDRGAPLIKLLDFGVAALQPHRSCSDHEIAGTAEFISPEVLLHGQSPDRRSDLWSLAVVAYACITGFVPYAGNTLTEVLLALANRSHTRPTSVCSCLPPEIDAWFDIALEKDPVMRFQSASAFAAAFQNAASRLRAKSLRCPRSFAPRFRPFRFSSVGS